MELIKHLFEQHHILPVILHHLHYGSLVPFNGSQPEIEGGIDFLTHLKELGNIVQLVRVKQEPRFSHTKRVDLRDRWERAKPVV